MKQMPVPLPRMCSVLAHELRSPLSVLQGYIRLLQRQRPPDHPEAAMLEAMLDATGRLTAIARQASELGGWLTTRSTLPLRAVAAAEVLEALSARADGGGVHVLRRGPGAADAVRLRADPPMLADAVVSFAESIRRETGDGMIEISLSDPLPEGSTGLLVRPSSAAGTPISSPSGSAAQRALSFDRGGAGLALIVASFVLDAHGASITPGNDDAIQIRFPPEGGAE